MAIPTLIPMASRRRGGQLFLSLDGTAHHLPHKFVVHRARGWLGGEYHDETGRRRGHQFQMGIGPQSGELRDNSPANATDVFLGYEQMGFVDRENPELFGAVLTSRCQVGSTGAETYVTTVGSGYSPRTTLRPILIPTPPTGRWQPSSITTQASPRASRQRHNAPAI